MTELSLTLPKGISRSRGRLRRPRRPTGYEVWLIFWTVWNVVGAVVSILGASWLLAIADGIAASYLWRSWLAERGKRPRLSLAALVLYGVSISGFLLAAILL